MNQQEEAEHNLKQEIFQNIADDIRDTKNPMFATEDTVDEIIQKHQLKGEAVVVAMLIMNTVLEKIAKGVENGRFG